MPLAMHRTLALTPSSLYDVPPEDDDDYIQDPDQLRDQLPQPFRMLDKIITRLLDDTWAILESRGLQKEKESLKIRPPQYECGVHIQAHEKATAACRTPDGKFILLGQPQGLLVLDATTNTTVVILDEANMEITNINVTILTDDIYLISTLDDMGVARLIALAHEKLYILQILNERNPESTTNPVASKCDISFDGEYAGVFLETPNSPGNGVLEILKLPRDSWQKDLENLHASSVKHQTRTHSPSQAEDGNASEQAPGDELVAPPSNEDDAVDAEDKRSQSPTSQRAESATNIGGEKSTHKFTHGQVVLKIKQPEPITGVSAGSPYQMTKGINHGDVIGTGTNHVLTAQHLEHRQAMFDHLHSNLLPYLPEKQQSSNIQPTFHFLTAGRMLPFGLEQSSLQGHTTSVAVWWTKGTQLLHYSLVKQSKDLEHKPDMVWPLSAPVSCTTVTPCTSLVAIALTNGNVVIWDKHLGIARRVIHITRHTRLTQLEFLDPVICPQEDNESLPYRTSSASYLRVCGGDGNMWLVNTGRGDKSAPMTAVPRLDSEEEMYTKILAVPGIPQLMVTCRKNGKVYIQDIMRSSILCEVTLPSGYSLATPWEPVVAIGGNGEMLYIRGEKSPSGEDAEAADPDADTEAVPDAGAAETSPSQQLFAFQLRSFPTLDRYRQVEQQQEPFMVHTTVETRINNLMKERISQQALRQTRMQERWEQLQNDLEMIQNLRNAQKPPPLGKKVFPLQEEIQI